MLCLKWFLSLRAVLAALAGLVWAAAFPQPGWSGLAYLAPALMLTSSLGARWSRAFALGYLAGLTHYLLSLHWLLYNPFPAGAAAGWLALSAYLALFPAVWVFCSARLLPAGLSEAPPLSGPGGTEAAGGRSSRRGFAWLVRQVAPLASVSWAQRTLWCLVCAALWVALEMARARLFTGFPWNPLGVSQQPLTPVIQMAAVTGVYGVSFVVTWVSLGLFCAAAQLAVRLSGRGETLLPPRPPVGQSLSMGWQARGRSSFLGCWRLTLFADIALPILAVMLLTVSGGAKLLTRPERRADLTIALVQPSIPQRLIFDPREATNRFNTLMDLTRLALAGKPDLLVWPEASLPSFEESHYRALTNLIAQHHVWMVFGADDAEPRGDPGGAEKYYYFNSAFLFDPQGQFAATYRKRHLVVFGEYIPLERFLPFLKHLTPIASSFTPGPAPVRFELDRPHAVCSPLICFEDVVPHLVREHVDGDTDFLLNLTNDAWFGESAAQEQHAANVAFRAVENGLPLVRCTNNGITCWIDAHGRIRSVESGAGRNSYRAGFKLVQAPLLSRGQVRPATFYRRYGDLFGWACVGTAVTALLGGHRRAPARLLGGGGPRPRQA
jgi:apolipoprotein N-acyltransferase